MWLVYRRSNYPLVATEIHDDKMTPGRVTDLDPAPIMSGMMMLKLDMQGRLIQFSAIPPQLEESSPPAPPVDWNPLFAAADLDAAKLQPAEPVWNSLAESDTRAAWTGVWPGSNRPLAWRRPPCAESPWHFP